MQAMDLLAELGWREMRHQYTDGLETALERHYGGQAMGQPMGQPMTGYCGFDPTAASLHIGNLVQIMGLVHLQRQGIRPVALLGGGTGMIGDPSGKSTERTLQTAEQVEANVEAIGAQLGRFLDFDGKGGALLCNNAEWLLPLKAVDFMRDVGKHFTVNYMLAKDSVQSRIEGGISYTEFSYMLLQAYDFLQLARRYNVTLQTGGSDQWGNMTAGLELIRRTEAIQANVLTLPLVTTASGAKFGKTESGAVWLDAKLTSPYKFYQFWINADDRDVGKYLRFFTLLSQQEVYALDRETEEHPERRSAQATLARDVTTRVHDAEAARIAESAASVLFGKGDPASLREDVLLTLADEIPSATVGSADVQGVLDLFVRVGVVKSKGEARRLADQGGAYVNGQRVSATATMAELNRLAGSHLLLRKGAREYAVVRVTD